MEKFTDIKLASYSIKKEYYPEKSYVKCPDCPKLLHCSYCVQYLRTQNPHHWVGIKINEVPGCRGCQERYQRGMTEATNEVLWLRKQLGTLEMRLASQVEEMKEARDIADRKLAAQQLAYEGAESIVEMNLKAQLEELSKANEAAESILRMKMRLELEKVKEAYEAAESRVTFLKRRPPDSAAAVPAGGSRSPLLGDITFAVQGREIYAHQFILAYKSTAFRNMFESGIGLILRKKTPEAVKDIDAEVAQVLSLPSVQAPPEEVLLSPPPLVPAHWEELSFPSVQAPPAEVLLSPPPPVQVLSEELPTPPPPPAQAHLEELVPSPPAPSLQEASPEECKEKPLKKPDKIYPQVKVRLAASSMLEQMGRRGVRCQLSVVDGQSLVDKATSQISSTSPQLAQGTENREETSVEIRSGTEALTGIANMIPPTSDALERADKDLVITKLSTELVISTPSLAPSVIPAAEINSIIQPQTNTDSETAPGHALGILEATTVPMLHSQPMETENRIGEYSTQNVALRFTHEVEPIGTLNMIPVPPLLAIVPPAGSAADVEVGGAVQTIIEVEDTSYAVMEAVINCCYTADIVFTDEVSPGEVLKVAHKYGIDYLTDLCDRELCRSLNAVNLPEMLKLGRNFGAKNLHSEATKFFKDNFDAVQESVLGNCC